MSEVLYKIRNVICSYDGQNPVLKIDSLDLHNGKQTVFIGKSGAGKSTILETLGLMNKTIIDGEIIFSPKDGTSYSLSTLWNNEEELAAVRNEYYSFIFQNTNLMDNFSAYENVCIPQMLQGVSLEEAKETITEAMRKVGLDEIDENEKVTHLSGGQRQRLAFVRAITPKFTVLFGDEPTGNLDEINSKELMKFVDSDVHNKKRSAILVSHDIDLSLEFADQIVLLVKDKNNSYGYVSPENIFTSNGDLNNKIWKDNTGKKLKDIRNLLLQKII